MCSFHTAAVNVVDINSVHAVVDSRPINVAYCMTLAVKDRHGLTCISAVTRYVTSVLVLL